MEQGRGARLVLVLLLEGQRSRMGEGLAKIGKGGTQELREKPPRDDMREEENNNPWFFLSLIHK